MCSILILSIAFRIKLLQTTIGDRLPIVQGGSFAYLPAAFGIIFNAELQAIADPSERFERTMRTIQGAIIVSGIVQMAIGYSGILPFVLRGIGPVTIAPVIAAIGLGLYGVGFSGVAACWPLGLTQMFTIVLFSQYLKFVKIGRVKVFSLFPVILAIAFTWSLGAILTSSGVWEEGNACRTDGKNDILAESPWFRIPYPFQWGTPIFKGWAIVPMLGSMIAGMIESIGDYFSCARVSGAPPPTPGIISRGLACEGVGVLIAGMIGTANGTTSYSENSECKKFCLKNSPSFASCAQESRIVSSLHFYFAVGAIAVTKVGSRAVVQCGACTMIVFACISKVGALFATMPGAMTSGMYCALFGLIVSVGIANLQYVDMNSPRNLYIVGFAIFNALSIAGPGGYFQNVEENPFGTSSGAAIGLSIFSSPMIVAFMAAFFLDNTVPGTRKERGLHVWDAIKPANINNDPEYVEVYSLPIGLAKMFRNCGYLEYHALGRLPDPPANGYVSSGGDIGDLCCPCWIGTKQSGKDDDDFIEEQPPKVLEEESTKEAENFEAFVSDLRIDDSKEVKVH